MYAQLYHICFHIWSSIRTKTFPKSSSFHDRNSLYDGKRLHENLSAQRNFDSHTVDKKDRTNIFLETFIRSKLSKLSKTTTKNDILYYGYVDSRLSWFLLLLSIYQSLVPNIVIRNKLDSFHSRICENAIDSRPSKRKEWQNLKKNSLIGLQRYDKNKKHTALKQNQNPLLFLVYSFTRNGYKTSSTIVVMCDIKKLLCPNNRTCRGMYGII